MPTRVCALCLHPCMCIYICSERIPNVYELFCADTMHKKDSRADRSLFIAHTYRMTDKTAYFSQLLLIFHKA